jgi:hypothetical protein
LATIGALRPVLYKWKKDTDQYKSVKTGNQPGLIAQEVQKVIPEVVTSINSSSMPATPGPDGRKPEPTLNQKLGTTYGVAYEKIVPYLIKAIQELESLLDAALADVAAIKDHLANHVDPDIAKLKAANDNHAAEHAADAKAIGELRAGLSASKVANDNEAAQIRALRARLDLLEAARR